MNHEALAAELHRALRTREPIPPLTERFPGMELDDAYMISRALLSLRLREGERVIGKKIGVTSERVQQMLGVHQPDYGWLTDRMAYPDAATMPIGDQLIQPRAEGEIAFVLGQTLRGPGITEPDVLFATDHVRVCIEVVDSRIRDWKIAIADTIADNASSGLFAVGDDRANAQTFDWIGSEMVVEVDGAEVSRGRASAVMGSPVRCVAWLANTLGAWGIPLQAGEIVLSGSLVPLIPVTPGQHMKVSMPGIGACSLTFS